MNKLLSLSITQASLALLRLIAISHFWACKVTTFFWNNNDFQHFFLKKFTYPLFYWYFHNMLYNIFLLKNHFFTPKSAYYYPISLLLSAYFSTKSTKFYAFLPISANFINHFDISTIHLKSSLLVLSQFPLPKVAYLVDSHICAINVLSLHAFLLSPSPLSPNQ